MHVKGLVVLITLLILLILIRARFLLMRVAGFIGFPEGGHKNGPRGGLVKRLLRDALSDSEGRK